MNSFISNLSWRFATKSFDKDKKVKEKDIDAILEAIRLAPTSFGLQPFQVYVVTDQKVKKKIKLNSFLQSQTTDCSHLLVFCADSDVKTKISQYIAKSSENMKIVDKVKLKTIQARMMTWLGGMNEAEVSSWATNQAYIALGFALAACAELKVDSCPMEGFISSGVNKILNVPKNQNSVVFLALGYRAKGPECKKVRLNKEDLFSNI